MITPNPIDQSTGEYVSGISKAPWYKRLVCSHYYIFDYNLEPFYTTLARYHCVDCGKTIERYHTPMNPPRETNQQYYDRQVASGNINYVMRPAIGTEGKPHNV